MEVTIFKNLHAAKPQRTPLEKIVEMIKTSPLLKEYTLEARRLYAAGEKEKGDSIKKNLLPAFAPAGYLLDGKGRDNLIGLTGLCFIDIDHVDEDHVKTSMALLREDEHVLLAARSISGKGLHILVPYSLWKEDPTAPLPATPGKMNQTYGSVFKSTATRYRELLGLPIDKVAGNAERLCLVSYDADAWYNPTAIPIVYQYVFQKSGKKPKSYAVHEG
jgi:hypothetical protein